MEEVLKEINRKYVKPPEYEVSRNKQILEEVVEFFTDKMSLIDPPFKFTYCRRNFYGGSVYDNLKIGKPDEFDIDLLLSIPEAAGPVLFESDAPGFVYAQLLQFIYWKQTPEGSKIGNNFKNTFLDENYCLSSDKTLRWMEGLVQRCLNSLEYYNGSYIFPSCYGTMKMSFKNSGPAKTLRLIAEDKSFKIEIDFVASFVFGADKWPLTIDSSSPFFYKHSEFFIVPKKPSYHSNGTYWRLSLQQQERELMSGKERLHSAVRLLKKMRDTLDHKCMCSYYIKTVFLHLLREEKATFWNQPLERVFMAALYRYRDFLLKGDLPYYWDPNFNLIGQIKVETLRNISNRVTAIIADVVKNQDKPETIMKYLVTSKELEENPVATVVEPSGNSCNVI